MEVTSQKILSFLFLRGTSCKKELILKACSLNEVELKSGLDALKSSCKNLPFTLLENSEEIELTLNEEMTHFFSSYIKKEKGSDLSPSTLQTLSIITYLKRPSLYEISFIRGVSAKQSVSTLIAKGLIEEYEDERYDLSLEAFSHLGITKKEDLPNYEEVKAGFLEKINNATSG